MPATIVPAAGETADVHVLLVDDEGPLDVTEPNYDRVLLDRLDLEAEHLGAVPSAFAYVSKWGPLLVASAPVPLGARPQRELLRLLGR